MSLAVLRLQCFSTDSLAHSNHYGFIFLTESLGHFEQQMCITILNAYLMLEDNTVALIKLIIIIIIIALCIFLNLGAVFPKFLTVAGS